MDDDSEFMPTFAYTALNDSGQQTRGTVSAGNRTSAIDQVMGKGLHPLEIEEAGAGAGAAKPAPRRGGRINARQIESFTRELANLLAGGVSLSKALHILGRESANAASSDLWKDIHDQVVDGTALGDALARHPKVFSPIYVAMVRAGEAGGFLDVVLNQIADFQSREADLKGRVKGAMIYPAVLAVFAVGVVVFLLTFFIPRFNVIFAKFGGALPALTQVIIAASDVVRHYGLFVAIAVAVSVVLIRRGIQSDQGQRAWEKALLITPGVGIVLSRFALIRFCRMFGTLIGSGVPLVNALRVAKEAIGFRTLTDALDTAIDDVRSGQALAKSLAACPRLFPASVIEMVSVAEETGRLDKELIRLAGSYEGDLDRRLRTLVALLEPLMLFLMAGLIGTIVVGMLLPVFSLSDLIK